MEYRVITNRITPVEIKLYKEEIEDIIKCLDYYMEHVELEDLNEKEDDKYEIWFRNLRTGLVNVLSDINETWHSA